MRLSPVPLLVFAAASALSRSAAASGSSSTDSRGWGTVVWDDETGTCADAGAVVAIVEKNIDTTPKRVPIFVRGEVTNARAHRLRASLFLRRGEAWGSREVDADSCESLRRAAGTVIALAYELGLDAHDRGDSGEPAPPSSAAPASSPQVELPAGPALPLSAAPLDAPPLGEQASTSPLRTGHLVVTGWLAGLVDGGTLPSVAPGARLAIGLEGPLWNASLGGLVLPAVSQTLSARTEGAAVGAAAASARGCGRLPVRESVEIDPCLGGSWGRYWAHGVGTSATQSGSATYLAIDASVDGVLALGKTARIRASVGGAFQASRPTFFVEGAGDVHRPAAFIVRAALGPELAF